MVPEPRYQAYRWEGEALILTLHVTPRAARDQWLGRQDDAFRVRITAAPADGRGNAHLLQFLAKIFGVARSQVLLLSGKSARIKRISIQAPKKLPIDIQQP